MQILSFKVCELFLQYVLFTTQKPCQVATFILVDHFDM
jgi:hypothetical protein